MKTMKIITLLALLFTALVAKGGNWQRLKKVDEYMGKDYNLRKDVAYMEIRFYKSTKSSNAYRTLKLYRKPLSSYPQETIAKFKALQQRHSNKDSYLRIRNNGNAFFIDTKGKMFWTDEKKDILLLLDKIDKPAEVALLLFLNCGHQWQYCKIKNSGYMVKSVRKITKCITGIRTNRVKKSDKNNMVPYVGKEIYHLSRKGSCSRRKNTKFISNKKIDYEGYSSIDIDSKGNLYTIAYVNRDKTYHASDYDILDKYSKNGKKLWSKTIKYKFSSSVRVMNGLIYILDGRKLIAKYNTNGKRIALAKEKVLPNANKSAKKYKIAIPRSEKLTKISVADYVRDKKGNVYVVGMEIFYPYGIPSSSSMCGNNDEVTGAIIAKLNSRGKTVWARVIDRDD